jgi:hypothetical protein
MTNLAPLARYGIVSLPHMPGTAFVVLPAPEPSAVFVARPNTPIYAEDGTRLDLPQGTENPGHATLLAWLHEIGAREPRFARVMLPTGQQDVPQAWIHPAGNIPTFRIPKAQPWRSAVA